MKLYVELVRHPETGAIHDLVQIPLETVRITKSNGVMTILQYIDGRPVASFKENEVLVVDTEFNQPHP